MTSRPYRSALLVTAIAGSMLLGSWTGGPAPQSKSDSLAIIRLVQPVNEKFHVPAALYISKGLGKISQVEARDLNALNSEMAVELTISDFLEKGYTLQNSTELLRNGVLTNTYYFKKKMG